MKNSKLTPIILIGIFFIYFLLLTPLGVFNDWIPAGIHTGIYSLTNIDPGDDSGYYAYLRSLFFDGDLDFYNERIYSHIENFNSTGYIFNNWQIGHGLLVFPFFLLGHFGAIILNSLGYSIALDGYSFPYHMSTALASQTYLFLSLLVVFQISQKFFEELPALLATLMIWAASPLIYYTFIRQRMAHTVEFFLAALFFWVWLNNRKSSNCWKHGLIGVILGLLSSVRLLSAGLVIIYVVDQIWLIYRHSFKKDLIKCWVYFALFGLIFISPQLITWQIIEGVPLPVYNINRNISYNTSFDFLVFLEKGVKFLVGHKWGILFSAPSLFLGVLGILFFKKLGVLRIPILIVIFLYSALVINYVNYLASYQFRYLIPVYPLISLGLGYIFNEIFKNRFGRITIITLCFSFALAQYFILIQYKINLSFADSQLTFNALANVPTIISERYDLLLRSSNFFKLFYLDFVWTYKEFLYFVFYPCFQLILVVIGYKVFNRIKKYFELVGDEKLKIFFVSGVLVIFLVNVLLVTAGSKKTKTEIDARQDYKKFVKQAENAEKRGDRKEVVLLLEKAVEAFPGFWPGNFRLALFLNAEENVDKANKYYQKVLRLNPQHQTSKFNLASNYLKQGKYQQAEELFRSSIQDNRMDSKSYQSLAQLLFKQKKVKEAELLFNRAIKLNPSFGLAYSNFAILLSSLHRYEEAERFFKKAIELNPKLAIAHINLAILLTNLKRYDEAIHYIKIAFDKGIRSRAMGNLMKFYGIQVYEIGKAK